jgi:hypothetical protein
MLLRLFSVTCQQPDREKVLLVRLWRSLACLLCAGVDGEGHPDSGVIWTGETRAA